MCLLVDSQTNDSIHREHFLTELHSVFNSFVPFSRHHSKPFMSIVKKRILGLFTAQLLLELLMLLLQEVERILQVLVAIDEHLVVLLEIIDQVLNEVQIVGVERRKLQWLEIFSRRLGLLIDIILWLFSLLNDAFYERLFCLALCFSQENYGWPTWTLNKTTAALTI